MERCECEHVNHFTIGRDGHAYNVPALTSEVETMFGRFKLCDECKEDGHMVRIERRYRC